MFHPVAGHVLPCSKKESRAGVSSLPGLVRGSFCCAYFACAFFAAISLFIASMMGL